MDADLDSCVPTDIITSSDKLGEELWRVLQAPKRGCKPPAPGRSAVTQKSGSFTLSNTPLNEHAAVLLWSITAALCRQGMKWSKAVSLWRICQAWPSLTLFSFSVPGRLLFSFSARFLFSQLRPTTRRRSHPLFLCLFEESRPGRCLERYQLVLLYQYWRHYSNCYWFKNRPKWETFMVSSLNAFTLGVWSFLSRLFLLLQEADESVVKCVCVFILLIYFYKDKREIKISPWRMPGNKVRLVHE